MKKSYKGVTLVEIAIVLVIIGLLLGGVLKGQELINNAKVRSIADRQNSLKVAWFAFIDRFQAMPGDFVRAAQYIPGAVNGDGDGFIDHEESPIAFQHMTAAGYLRCPQCTVKAHRLNGAWRHKLVAKQLWRHYGHFPRFRILRQSAGRRRCQHFKLACSCTPVLASPATLFRRLTAKLTTAFPAEAILSSTNGMQPGCLQPSVGLCTSHF